LHLARSRRWHHQGGGDGDKPLAGVVSNDGAGDSSDTYPQTKVDADRFEHQAGKGEHQNDGRCA
jgi:hypothetical protein